MENRNWYRVWVVCLVCATTATAQTFTTLVNFNGASGAGPLYMSLVQGIDGNFYGTTVLGGTNNDGSIFQITPAGRLTPLHSFTFTDGSNPYAGLVQGADGNFYGTTWQGGSNIEGTIFKITPVGTVTTLYSFCAKTDCADGSFPKAGLVQATDGSFYGTTWGCAVAWVCGTIFKISTVGTLTTIYSFCSNCVGGSVPTAGLVQGTDGSFYGTTNQGGTNNSGIVFKITPEGTLSILHSFDSTTGAYPFAGLVQGTDGNLYGTTSQGGRNGGGTIFKLTSGGTLTTLYSFCAQNSCDDGLYPLAALIQATDGKLYGTTSGGGSNGYGTIFRITPSGTLITLHSFSWADGASPSGGLVQGTDGKLYGTTSGGGSNGYGTIFKLSLGLAPFVKTLPTSNKVGASIRILGTDLTGATSVTFSATAAAFAVISPSEILATVPVGAVTGKVQVITPSGTLTSNVVFRVMPVISSFSPTSGPVGTAVTITGEAFTGATSVTFGGVKATSFTVNSYKQITATVPTGAVTGKISVTTPGGKAVSTGTFTVN